MALCLVLWLCILQSLYYPFLSDSRTAAEWWQVGPMAGAGFMIGLPVLLLWESFLKDRQYSELSFWLLSAAYVLSIYCLVAAGLRRFAANRQKHGDI